MAKKRSKRSRRRPTSYQSRPRPKTTAPKMEQAQPAATVTDKARQPSTPQPRPVYTGRKASHLAAVNIDDDQVMYSYVKKDLTRIGILTLIMFGTLVVLKIAGVS